jgi:hypothetical protein
VEAMENPHAAHVLPQAAHPVPIDPVAEKLQSPPTEADTNRLQEVLPEIKDLAQKVGGMKNLAEIAEALEEAEE